MGARLTERIWEQPSAAVIAMTVAVIVGVVATVVSGRRLLHRITTEVTRT